MTSSQLQVVDDIASFAKDPLGFMRYVYDWESGELTDFTGPHEWQANLAEAIGAHLRSEYRFQPLKIAVSSGRGIGKSALIAMLADWAMSTCDDCRVIVTANTEDQLATKTWPEINKWFRRAINADWWTHTATKITVKDPSHADTWRMDRQTWSEHNVEAFRGLHNARKRMVVIFDEAAGIHSKIWEATEGSLTDADTEMIWIAFSNPSQPTGKFRECFGRLKHRWLGFQIDSRAVPGTNREEIDRWIEDYGEDSDYVRVNVKGEFPRAGSAQFISGEVVTQARKRVIDPKEYLHLPVVLVVDVARFGDDQTVIGTRQGPKLTILEKLRGQDTVQVSSRVLYHFRALVPRSVVIDGDGIGGGVVDSLKAMIRDDKVLSRGDYAKNVFEFHGGAKPNDAYMYFNRRAEVWGMMRKWLETADIPDDAELDTDLTGPEYFFSGKNQIQLEKKEDMKKRGLSSPDSGDMLAMSFAVQIPNKSAEESLRDRLKTIEIQAPNTDAAEMAMHFERLRATAERQQVKKKGYWG